MLVSLKLKEIIILLKTNKDLIHTIQTILQVFPEGVIIRSLDETSKQTILKFANNIAKKVLIDEDAVKEGVKLKVIDSDSFHSDREHENLIDLDEFLSQQENSILFEDSAWAEQMIKVKQTLDQLQDDFVNNADHDQPWEETFFNVKSIKVWWDNNKESFMHVFVNTTQVKKLEQEKANRQYQHIMFASLSHELRTPLNAFLNSLYLVKFTI